MSSQPSQVQVLEKADYRNQHIVPFHEPLPPLAPSSIRVQSTTISLTTNNITYARLGDVPGLNWFDAHPLPFKSGPYADSSKYACISAWGVGTVIESTVDWIPVETKIWGYLPIASLPVDKVVEPSKASGVIIETTSYRKHLMPVYNLYFVLDKTHAKSEKFHAYSALTKVLFETGYHLNRMCFSWDPTVEPVNPLGLQPPPPMDTWSKERANLRDSTVVIMPASSKTAFAFAYVLRNCRPKHEQPKAVIGVTSHASREFCKETRLYDKLPLYEEAEGNNAESMQGFGLSKTGKVVLIDFGAREGFKSLWRNRLEAASDNVMFIRVASAIPDRIETPEDKEKNLKARLDLPPNSWPANASAQRDAGMKYYGEAEYLEDLSKEFDRFVESGCIDALKPTWGQGMEGVERGWNRLCSGKMGAAEGLVFRLP